MLKKTHHRKVEAKKLSRNASTKAKRLDSQKLTQRNKPEQTSNQPTRTVLLPYSRNLCWASRTSEVL